MTGIAGLSAVVTGASSGIGAATARALAKRGGRVALLARTESALNEVAEGIRREGGEAHVYVADVTDPDAVTRATTDVERDLGGVDILVNNAGAGRWLWLEDTPPEEAVAMMASPYFGAFFVTRALLPGMLKRARGHIVNLTSPAGFVAWPGATGYVAARWAMRGFHEALRADLRGTGIRTTLVVPGLVRSSYFINNPGAGEEHLPDITRLFRALKPEEVAESIAGAVGTNRQSVVLPLLLRITLAAYRLAPAAIEWALFRGTPGHREGPLNAA